MILFPLSCHELLVVIIVIVERLHQLLLILIDFMVLRVIRLETAEFSLRTQILFKWNVVNEVNIVIPWN